MPLTITQVQLLLGSGRKRWTGLWQRSFAGSARGPSDATLFLVEVFLAPMRAKLDCLVSGCAGTVRFVSQFLLFRPYNLSLAPPRLVEDWPCQVGPSTSILGNPSTSRVGSSAQRSPHCNRVVEQSWAILTGRSNPDRALPGKQTSANGHCGGCTLPLAPLCHCSCKLRQPICESPATHSNPEPHTTTARRTPICEHAVPVTKLAER